MRGLGSAPSYLIYMAIKHAKTGKLRNRSGAKKRVRRTGSGKYVMQKGAHNHLLQQKSKRQKRLAKKMLVTKGVERHILDRVLPSR